MQRIRVFLVTALLLVASATLLCAGAAPVAPWAQQRKTSEPYTGDLTVFDSPGRDERLQINRVMDILGIAPGKASPTLEPGRDGSRFERQGVWAEAAWFTRSTLILRR